MQLFLWPKSVCLKCFGNQLKTVYLQGPHSSRPCISRPCCNLRKQRKTKTRSSKRPLYYQNCLRIFAHFQWMRGEKVPRESKKCPGTLWGFSSIFVRAHKDSSRCCQAESLGLLPLSPPSLLFLSSLCTKVNFSSCQRNLRKTFQIDGMITLISKRP